MKPSLIVLFTIASVILLAGVTTLFSGLSHPVYTDAKAPEELSRALEDLPRDERFESWYQKLPEYETPHKSHTDLGRGLIALGLGISCGGLLLQVLSKAGEKRVAWWIWGFWTLLWAIKFPFSVWYYSLRQSRFDYPVWGDSIAIGLFQDFMAWIVGFIIFTILLKILMIRFRFSTTILLRAPEGTWGWTRVIVLWLWFALLLACIVPTISDGDEGMIISCVGAIPVILLALSGIKQSHNNTSSLTPDSPRVQSVLTTQPSTQKSERGLGQDC